MQLEFQCSYDAKVATAAAQRPEQVHILHRIGPAKFAVGGHDLSGNQIINGCAVLAHEPTQSAAESKPRDASVGDGAARGSKAVGLCRSIEFPPQHTTLGARGAVYRIHADPLHG